MPAALFTLQLELVEVLKRTDLGHLKAPHPEQQQNRLAYPLVDHDLTLRVDLGDAQLAVVELRNHQLDVTPGLEIVGRHLVDVLEPLSDAGLQVTHKAIVLVRSSAPEES